MTTLVPSFYNRSYSFLQIRTTSKSLDEFEFSQDPITVMELAALEHLKN